MIKIEKHHFVIPSNGEDKQPLKPLTERVMGGLSNEWIRLTSPEHRDQALHH